MKYLFTFLMLSLLTVVNGQSPLSVAGMDFTYVLQGDSVTLTLKAPTQGWVLVGFNDQAGIVGADLKMLGVKQGQGYASDQTVVGIGKHPNDAILAGRNDIRLLYAEEFKAYTQVTFRIPLRSGDSLDFQHQRDRPFWLILAYSVSDDWEHHSRVRRHLQFDWTHGHLK